MSLACDVDEVLRCCDRGKEVVPAGGLVPLAPSGKRYGRQRLRHRVRVRVQRDPVAAPRLEVRVLVLP